MRRRPTREDELANELCIAAERGDVSRIRKLLDQGVDVNARRSDRDGETALHSAIRRGSVEAVRALMEEGADLDVRDGRGRAALHIAVARPNVEILRYVLQRDVDREAKSRDNWTALHLAAGLYGNVDAVRVLLQRGAKINALGNLGRTPLHWAAERNQIDVVRLLIENKADMSAQVNDESTVLHLAATGSAGSEVMQLLIQSGAKVNAQNKNGMTPLDALLSKRSADISELLIKARTLLQAGATMDDSEVLVRNGRESNTASAILTCFELWRRQSEDGTHLIEIPYEVLKQGPQSIQAYVFALTNSTSPLHLHVACVVGPSRCGKTSCIKSLISGIPRLENEDTRTVGVDCVSHEFESAASSEDTQKHTITFWDFAGQEVYHTAHSVFFSRRAVYVMVVDLAAYESKFSDFERPESTEEQRSIFVEAHIVQWLRLIFSRLPDADIVFIGTKQDLMTGANSIDTIKSDLSLQLSKWCENEHEATKRPGVQSWNLQKDKLKTEVNRMIVMSSKNRDSLQPSMKLLQEIIVTRNQGFLMPDAYSLVLEKLRQRDEGKSLTDRARDVLMTKQEAITWLVEQTPSLYAEGCEAILSTLHDLGDVLWFDDSVGDALSDKVCLAPIIVINFIREIISHELFDLMHEPEGHKENTARQQNTSVEVFIEQDEVRNQRKMAYEVIAAHNAFHEWREALVGRGCVAASLITYLPLWQELLAGSVDDFVALKCLMQNLGLAYPSPTSPICVWTSLIVPAYWKLRWSVDNSSTEDLAVVDITEHHFYSVEYVFYGSHFPPTLFEQVIVRTHDANAPRVVTTPIRVIAKLPGESVVIMELVGNNNMKVLRVQAVAVSKFVALATVHQYCLAIEPVLKQYRGLDPIRQVVWDREDDPDDIMQLDDRPVFYTLKFEFTKVRVDDAFTSVLPPVQRLDTALMKWSLEEDGNSSDIRRIDVVQSRFREETSHSEVLVTDPVLRHCRLRVDITAQGSTLMLGHSSGGEIWPSNDPFESAEVKVSLYAATEKTVVGEIKLIVTREDRREAAMAA